MGIKDYNHLIKREQKKFTYSAERENGRMKFNNLIRFTSIYKYNTEIQRHREK